ncbi:MAG TPA: flagellar basal body rod protein FlgB [Geobacteraceae bacterium]
MAIDGLFDTTISLLGKNLDLRVKNHNMISANIANAETPGYIPTTLSFEKELKAALNNRMGVTPSVTDPRHIPLKGEGSSLEGVAGTVVESPAGTPGRDGNGVELDNEMGRLAENQILYNATVQIVAKEFESLKIAIRGSM